MSSIIVCKSIAHGNTRQLADAIAEVIDARVVGPDEVDPNELAEHDLIGFGSGIYNRRYHRDLRTLVAAMPTTTTSRAFVFASSGFPDKGLTRFLQPLGPRLTDKGYDVVGTFSCRGLDTSGPLALFGGVRGGHPDTADLAAVREFARGLPVSPVTRQ